MRATVFVDHFHAEKRLFNDPQVRRSSMIHTPVMVGETLHYLLHEDSRRILDCTVGCGGHAEAVLDSNDNISLIGVDRDPDAIAGAQLLLKKHRVRLRLVEGNYADLRTILSDNETVDGILVDLGVSSLQLDTKSRGFSYSHDGPLDMRMGPAGTTAKSLIEGATVEELTRILKEYGEVRGAARIARSIHQAATDKAMSSTFDLKNAVDAALAGQPSPSLLSRVFQAIRIALNAELVNIEAFLSEVLDYLRPDGRLVVISYHSLEDRIVKRFLKQESTDCLCPPGVPQCVCRHKARLEMLTRRAVKPSAKELAGNPRSRSARLRAARLVGREAGRLSS